MFSSEIIVGPNISGTVFPDVDLSIQSDKPFEVHRMVPRLTALASIQYDGQAAAVVQPADPQPETMDKRIRLTVNDFTKSTIMTKNATLLNSFITENRKTWDWDAPYTIERSTGFQVQVDSLDFPSVCVADITGSCAAPTKIAITQCRVEVAFHGFLIVVAAPTEQR